MCIHPASGFRRPRDHEHCLVQPVPADMEALCLGPPGNSEAATAATQCTDTPRPSFPGRLQSSGQPVRSLLKTLGLPPPLRKEGKLQIRLAPPHPRQPSNPTMSSTRSSTPNYHPKLQTPPALSCLDRSPHFGFFCWPSASHGYLAWGPHCSANSFQSENRRQEPPCSTMPQASVLLAGRWLGEGHFRQILRHSNTVFYSNPNKLFRSQDK